MGLQPLLEGTLPVAVGGGCPCSATASWFHVKVAEMAGASSLSCVEVLVAFSAHRADDATIPQTAGSEFKYSFSHPSFRMAALAWFPALRQ